ncbi:hypothetical protein ABK040_003609 [Willaertia magna]
MSSLESSDSEGEVILVDMNNVANHNNNNSSNNNGSALEINSSTSPPQEKSPGKKPSGNHHHGSSSGGGGLSSLFSFFNSSQKDNSQSSSPSSTDSDCKSVHLTAFEIEDDDIINFGKPLTSTTSSAAVSKQKKFTHNILTPYKEEVIQIEEDSGQHTPSNPNTLPTDDIVTPNKENKESKENSTPLASSSSFGYSFYKKWFGGSDNTTNEEEKIPQLKVAIIGDDLYDPLVASEFLLEEIINANNKTNEEQGSNNNAEKNSPPITANATAIDSSNVISQSTQNAPSPITGLNTSSRSCSKVFKVDEKEYDLQLYFFSPGECDENSIREFDGYLVVYNVCDRKSFSDVDKLYEIIYNIKGGKSIAMVLVGIEYLARGSSRTLSDSTPSTTDEEIADMDLYRKRSTLSEMTAVETAVIDSFHINERLVSRREGLKKSLQYFIPYVEINASDPKPFLLQKVTEVFQEIVTEIKQGGTSRFCTVKPPKKTGVQYVFNTPDTINSGIDQSPSGGIQANIEEDNNVFQSFRLLFSNLSVSGYCLTNEINNEQHLREIEFLIDNLESHKVTPKVIEICLKRFDYRIAKLKLKQGMIPHNEQQILSFLFDIPLKKKSLVQSFFIKKDERFRGEIIERLIFSIFIVTFCKQLYLEKNCELFDKTFIIPLEEEWKLMHMLKSLFDEVKRKCNEYSSIDNLLDEQILRILNWMERKMILKKGNEVEILMRFLLLNVTSKRDYYLFEERVRPRVFGEKYLVLKKIAENHNGRVYKAVNIRKNRLCIIKQLVNVSKADLIEMIPDFEGMIRMEQHHNVMTYSDYKIKKKGIDKCDVYIEMEHMNGGRLDKKLASYRKHHQNLAYFDALDIALQISKGVKHLHEKGFVLVNLKPDKIYLHYEKFDDFSYGETTSTSNANKLQRNRFSTSTRSLHRKSVLEEEDYTFKRLGSSRYSSSQYSVNSAKSTYSDHSHHNNNTLSTTPNINNEGTDKDIKSIKEALEDSTSILEGTEFTSNVSVKLVDWIKPWDFSNEYNLRNKQIVSSLSNLKTNHDDFSLNSYPTLSASRFSTFKKNQVISEITSSERGSSNRGSGVNSKYNGDIELYLDQKDDIFRLGCIIYQLFTKEMFIRTISQDQEVTKTIEQSILTNEHATHQIMAAKIHLNLIMNEALDNNTSNLSSTNGSNNTTRRATTGSVSSCSSQNEKLLCRLLQSMIQRNPNNRPTLQRVILTLETLVKYPCVTDEVIDSLLPSLNNNNTTVTSNNTTPTTPLKNSKENNNTIVNNNNNGVPTIEVNTPPTIVVTTTSTSTANL